jgi:hypothetical protein
MPSILNSRFAHAALLAVQIFALTGCGGSVGGEQNGSATGAGPGVGGGAPTGGNGNTLGGSAAGGNVSAGGQATGGYVAGGYAGVGGFAGSGGMNCETVDCAYFDCPPDSVSATLAGSCCPTCIPLAPSCSNVNCAAATNCPTGFVRQRLPGACCDGCVPVNPPEPPNCMMVNCAPPRDCPLGYRHSQPVYNCCNDCEPDPNYCQVDSDCIVAQKPSGCCGCPSAISTRLYQQDSCYSAVDTPRPIPSECIPDVMCAMICGACPSSGIATCIDHQCTEVYPI